MATSNEMLGPVKDGGRIEYITVPGCWGTMITPSIRSGHEVSLPVRVESARIGDAVALRIETLEQTSRATTSGTHVGVEGRFISDPFVANICPTCQDAGRHFLYPDTYLDGIGEGAVKCKACHSEVMAFHMVEGYTMVFDEPKGIGVTVSRGRAGELANNAREWVALTEHSTQDPIVVLGRADLVGTMTRCRISAGNLGYRSTISGAVDIGRLPGFVQLSLLVLREKLEPLGILHLVEAQYGAPQGW